MTLSFVIIALLVFVIIALLCLMYGHDLTLKHERDLAHRDRVDSRARLLEIIREQRLSYEALTASYLRTEGKVYITPITRVDENHANPTPPGRTPDPPKHAFKMRPVPPVKVGTVSVGAASGKVEANES